MASNAFPMFSWVRSSTAIRLSCKILAQTPAIYCALRRLGRGPCPRRVEHELLILRWFNLRAPELARELPGPERKVCAIMLSSSGAHLPVGGSGPVAEPPVHQIGRPLGHLPSLDLNRKQSTLLSIWLRSGTTQELRDFATAGRLGPYPSLRTY